jgi:hypothetical protein
MASNPSSSYNYNSSNNSNYSDEYDASARDCSTRRTRSSARSFASRRSNNDDGDRVSRRQQAAAATDTDTSMSPDRKPRAAHRTDPRPGLPHPGDYRFSAERPRGESFRIPPPASLDREISSDSSQGRAQQQERNDEISVHSDATTIARRHRPTPAGTTSFAASAGYREKGEPQEKAAYDSCCCNDPHDHSQHELDPKGMQGIDPGGPMPGAYNVRGRARGEVPVWGQQYSDADSDDDSSAYTEVVQRPSSSRRMVGGNRQLPPTPESEAYADEPSTQSMRGAGSETSSVQENASHFGKQKCSFVGFSLIVVAAIIAGIAVALHVGKGGKETPRSACDSNAEELLPAEFILMQCTCYNLLSDLSEDAIARSQHLRGALNLDDSTDWFSCENQNMALMMLASNPSSTGAGNEVLLNRYVFNVLFLAMDGGNWIESDGWLEANNDCPCCFFGVTCEGDSVVSIELKGNNVSGVIPSDLYRLTALTSLDLSKNFFIRGWLAPQVGQLSNLKILDLSTNFLTSTLPNEIGLLTDLEIFRINSNGMTGSFPFEIATLTKLLEFNVGDNEFIHNSSLPLWHVTSLKDVNAANCEIAGTIPPEIGFMTSLSALVLSDNVLSGSIPSEIGLLTQLEVLNLSGNNVQGTLPVDIGNCFNLISIALFTNEFTGTIPNDALGRLVYLEELNLGTNKFSGSVPASSGICELQTNGTLKKFIADCGTDYAQESLKPEVVCQCCTECIP